MVVVIAVYTATNTRQNGHVSVLAFWVKADFRLWRIASMGATNATIMKTVGALNGPRCAPIPVETESISAHPINMLPGEE